MPKSKLSVFNFQRPDGKENFGDNISPNLIARVANCETVWARNTHADVIAMGSIIQSFNNRKKSWQTRANRFFKKRQIIWGSGLIQHNHHIQLQDASTVFLSKKLNIHCTKYHRHRQKLQVHFLHLTRRNFSTNLGPFYQYY